MHILFIHQNYPAQFGHLAAWLTHRGHRCTFLTEKQLLLPPSDIQYLTYKVAGGATAKNHYCSRTFENGIWRAHAVYEACKSLRANPPDLIVAHAGFGSSLFLKELFAAPIINYFEYYYHSVGTDLDFRPDFPCTELQRLRSRARNAMLQLDLENCTAGYSPTLWQRDRLPTAYRNKVRVCFDGIDTSMWKPVITNPPQVLKRDFPLGTKFISFVARGFESMRGFDIFMRAASKVTQHRSDVYFLIVGEDRNCYGDDTAITGNPSFKNWVIDKYQIDTSHFIFTGRLSPKQLVNLWGCCAAHVYLTVPFVLSWSLFNALACGVPVIASSTPPVCEIIKDEVNGILVDFFDIDNLANQMNEALDQASDYRATLGLQGIELIQSRYSQELCCSQLETWFENTINSNHEV